MIRSNLVKVTRNNAIKLISMIYQLLPTTEIIIVQFHNEKRISLSNVLMNCYFHSKVGADKVDFL